MMTKTFKIITFLFITLYFSSGCLFNTKDDFDKLPDRKFYFSEFQFILTGQDKEKAFNFFKEFPVKKIMFMAAKEYNISIDISDFNNFISSKKPSILKADGAFRIDKHTWGKRNIENNRIVFIFSQDYFDGSKLKLQIGIYNGSSALKIINVDISKIEYIFNQLQFHFKSGKESLKEYEEKNYDKISPIPMIIETNINSSKTEEPADLIKIKLMIDAYVKSLDQNDKVDFKHDIIDYIYKKCD